MKKTILLILLSISIYSFADEYTDLQSICENAGVPENLAVSVAEKTRERQFSKISIDNLASAVKEAKTNEAVKMAEKIAEGIAKNVSEDNIVNAVDNIRERYSRAYKIADKIKLDKKTSAQFADAVADAMTAGATAQKLETVAAEISVKKDKAYTAINLYREMMQYGVDEETTEKVTIQAVKKLSAGEINEYRKAFAKGASYGNASGTAKQMGKSIHSGKGASSMGSSAGGNRGSSGGNGHSGGNGNGGGRK
ncbi:hypothetical protein Dacet_0978 [Denitrovibrio acetiphilus DSM 12809]|uniref:Uncharacterized protein n=1 Tax=Denitrovibrio acetiphilus (strain DSM 12809 / NBRC 114555 / N2460) TaxID=522772 RepID=D4H6P0_DENA2|nr:hypothetical protein [Denitrovibrio acetiphilus]ADD67756.1 hypothetical protein Dacet_0978 [Denitrovibrio acetiphilus DSM 12809]